MSAVAVSSQPRLSWRARLGQSRWSSVVVWLALVGYLVLVKGILGLLPPLNVRVVASEFAWSTIGLYGLVGLAGVWLADRTGFPAALDGRISQRQRLLWPLLAGAGLAALAIVIDVFSAGTRFIEAQTGEPSFNVYFPASLLVYTGGIVLVEVVFRLVLLPALLGLIGYGLLRRRWLEPTFWVLAVGLSLLEPVTQGLGILLLKPTNNFAGLLLTQFLPYFITDYPLNLGQAAVFRKYGFLASVAMRLGFYLVWHLAYGNFIYPLWVK